MTQKRPVPSTNTVNKSASQRNSWCIMVPWAKKSVNMPRTSCEVARRLRLDPTRRSIMTDSRSGCCNSGYNGARASVIGDVSRIHFVMTEVQYASVCLSGGVYICQLIY